MTQIAASPVPVQPSANDMTIPAFEPEVRDGRLYGRGACDTKGSMAAMLACIKRVIDADGAPPVTTYFVSTCDEELGGLGARHLVESGFAPDACVVGDAYGILCRWSEGIDDADQRHELEIRDE